MFNKSVSAIIYLIVYISYTFVAQLSFVQLVTSIPPWKKETKIEEVSLIRSIILQNCFQIYNFLIIVS